MEAIPIHPLDLFEILSKVNSDPVEIRLQRLTLDGEPLLHYPGSLHEVDGVLYEQTTAVPHTTTRFDDELKSLGLQPFHPEPESACAERVDINCGGKAIALLCGEPESAHTPEAARGDVGMDHDFTRANGEEPQPASQADTSQSQHETASVPEDNHGA